jgi:4-amino-4-deoxy-L-arabinose transferase-like glycosyltransferase
MPRRRENPRRSVQRTSSLSSLESFLTTYRTTVVFALLVAAGLIRVAAFIQLNSTPLVDLEQWRETDMHYYDAWARRIADGDWLSRRVFVPMNRWQQEVAQEYLAGHHDDPAQANSAAHQTQTDVDSVLWSRWMRLPAFYQDPLYAYVIAGVRKTVDDDVRAVLVLQLLLGVGSVFLLWWLTTYFFGAAAGAFAGVLALACAPLPFYELLLLRDSMIVFAATVLAALSVRAADSRRSLSWCAALGVIAALSCLLKSTFLLMIILVPLGLAWQRVGRRRLAIYGAGLVLGFAPLIVRNLEVRVPPFTVASSGPFTFLSANEGNALPDVGFGTDAPLLAHFLGDTDGSWIGAMRAVAASQTFSGYADLLWGKWRAAWHWYEIPNNENLYYSERLVPVLRWLPLNFGVIAPFALIGIVLSWGRRRETWPLFALLLVALVPLLSFYVLGRFRILLIATAIPFAASTLVDAWRRLSRGSHAQIVMIAATVVVLGVWTEGPLGPHEVLIRTSDWLMPYSALYEGRIVLAVEAREWAAAAQTYAEFFKKYEPSPAEIQSSRDPQLVGELAHMHQQCAELFQAAGDVENARRHTQAAQALLDSSMVR